MKNSILIWFFCIENFLLSFTYGTIELYNFEILERAFQRVFVNNCLSGISILDISLQYPCFEINRLSLCNVIKVSTEVIGLISFVSKLFKNISLSLLISK